jgi:hypothetical protein
MVQWRTLATIAVVAGILVAGCSSSDSRDVQPAEGGGAGADRPDEIVRLQMTQVNDTELARAHAMVTNSGSQAEMRVLAEIEAEGSSMHRGNLPLFNTGRPVLYNGTIYNITHEVGETTPRIDYAVTLNPVEEGEGIRFDQLPAVDRRQFEDGNLTDGIPFGIGTQFEYTEQEVENSVLVPEPQHSVIVWDSGDRAEITIDRAQRDELTTYHYSGKQLAPDAHTFGNLLRERRAFQLTGLTANETVIVETAVQAEDGYARFDDDPVPAAFSRLVDRFPPENVLERRDQSPTGSYIVQYNGSVYLTLLDFRRGALSGRSPS